jgi:hypothetical protein
MPSVAHVRGGSVAFPPDGAQEPFIVGGCTETYSPTCPVAAHMFGMGLAVPAPPLQTWFQWNSTSPGVQVGFASAQAHVSQIAAGAFGSTPPSTTGFGYADGHAGAVPIGPS